MTDHSLWVHGYGFGSLCVDLLLCSSLDVAVPLSCFISCSRFDVFLVLTPFGGSQWLSSYLAGVVLEI
jgi:hypothetical protein